MSAVEQFREADQWDAEDDFSALEAMEWAKPENRRGQVDWAGRRFTDLMRRVTPIGTPSRASWEDQDFLDWDKSLDIINNWRSAHAYPLNTFQATLRGKSKRIDSNADVAQRTKRLWSIWHKLDRFQSMQLSQMQDIAGIRAIVATGEQVKDLVSSYQDSRLRHGCKLTDYVTTPRSSGYRGVHLIWKYLSDKSGAQIYNGLSLEMQIRSRLQHTWATTVETMGRLMQQALKSSLGDSDWLRFFALMGSVVACRESAPMVPNTPTDIGELIQELRVYAERTHARQRLRTIGNALREIEDRVSETSEAHYFLLELTENLITITGFTARQQQEAQKAYTEVEKRITTDENSDAVLVSVDSIASLRRAYPNYFLDTGAFADLLEEALSDGFPSACGEM